MTKCKATNPKPEHKKKPGAKVTTVRCNGYCFVSKTMCPNKYRGNKPKNAPDDYLFYGTCGQLKCVKSSLTVCGSEERASKLDSMCANAADAQDPAVKAVRIMLMQDVRDSLGKMAPVVMQRRTVKANAQEIKDAADMNTHNRVGS